MDQFTVPKIANGAIAKSSGWLDTRYMHPLVELRGFG